MKSLAAALVCLVLAGLAFSQTSSEPVLKPRVNPPVEELTPSSDTVAPDAPVVTVQGVCEKSGDGAASADCKTVITRSQFEKLLSVIQPNMPKQGQKQLATHYVIALMLAQKAHDLGLDKGPEFDEQMYLARLQLVAKLGGEQMQKDAAKVSDAEIEDYYKQHSGDFKTISYERIYVPKQKQEPAAANASDPEAQKKREASEAAMKEEADKLRARAAAGEDFAKLQQEAYDFAGLKLKATNAPVNKVTKKALPPNDASIFELKKGEVSPVIADPQAFMIYKVEDFQDPPLADVREDVSRIVQGEKMKNFSESLQKSAADSTTYNEAYFAVPAPPSLRKPGEATPAPATPAPGKK